MPASSLHTLETARSALKGASCWVLTDGKAGDLAQCLGIAERLGLAPEERVVSPRAPYVWLMPHTWRLPWIGIDPAEAPGRTGSPLQPPWPDIVIASGRRAAPYLPAIRRASGGRTFTTLLKDPRTSPAIADFLWVPEHDPMRGPNVFVTPLSPHRITPEALATLQKTPPQPIAALPHPRVAVLVGGDSKDFRYTDADTHRFAAALGTVAATGAGLMATASRRTPPALAEAVRATVEASGGWFWDGRNPDIAGKNPYRALLANADVLIAPAESVNMVGEALATGKPVHVFRPTGGSRKIDQFLARLDALGVTRPFSGTLESYTYPPMDATPVIAIELACRYTEFRKHGRAWSPAIRRTR